MRNAAQALGHIAQAVDLPFTLVKRVQQRPPVAGEDPYQFGPILFPGQYHALPDNFRAAPRVNQILAQNAVGIRYEGHQHHLPVLPS